MSICISHVAHCNWQQCTLSNLLWGELIIWSSLWEVKHLITTITTMYHACRSSHSSLLLCLRLHLSLRNDGVKCYFPVPCLCKVQQDFKYCNHKNKVYMNECTRYIFNLDWTIFLPDPPVCTNTHTDMHITFVLYTQNNVWNIWQSWQVMYTMQQWVIT